MTYRKSKLPSAHPESDASERLMRAEGADVPHQADGGRPRRRLRRHPRRDLVVHAPQHPDRRERSPVDGDGPREVADERPSEATVAARIRDLEARLDQMIDAREREREVSDSQFPPRPGTRSAPPPAPASAYPPPVPDGPTREFLQPDVRQWGRLGLRDKADEVDDFGYDPAFEQKALPLFEFLYERYFRVEVRGSSTSRTAAAVFSSPITQGHSRSTG